MRPLRPNVVVLIKIQLPLHKTSQSKVSKKKFKKTNKKHSVFVGFFGRRGKYGVFWKSIKYDWNGIIGIIIIYDDTRH